jgi:hypothetical protein
MALVVQANPSFEALAHRARTEDDHVVVRRKPARDPLDEAFEVLDPMRLSGGLRRSTTSVTDAGIVPDVAGRAVVRRHVGLLPLDKRPVVPPAHDDRVSGVDPDQCGLHDTRVAPVDPPTKRPIDAVTGAEWPQRRAGRPAGPVRSGGPVQNGSDGSGGSSIGARTLRELDGIVL